MRGVLDAMAAARSSIGRTQRNSVASDAPIVRLDEKGPPFSSVLSMTETVIVIVIGDTLTWRSTWPPTVNNQPHTHRAHLELLHVRGSCGAGWNVACVESGSNQMRGGSGLFEMKASIIVYAADGR